MQNSEKNFPNKKTTHNIDEKFIFAKIKQKDEIMDKILKDRINSIKTQEDVIESWRLLEKKVKALKAKGVNTVKVKELIKEIKAFRKRYVKKQYSSRIDFLLLGKTYNYTLVLTLRSIPYKPTMSYLFFFDFLSKVRLKDDTRIDREICDMINTDIYNSIGCDNFDNLIIDSSPELKEIFVELKKFAKRIKKLTSEEIAFLEDRL